MVESSANTEWNIICATDLQTPVMASYEFNEMFCFGCIKASVDEVGTLERTIRILCLALPTLITRDNIESEFLDIFFPQLGIFVQSFKYFIIVYRDAISLNLISMELFCWKLIVAVLIPIQRLWDSIHLLPWNNCKVLCF